MELPSLDIGINFVRRDMNMNFDCFRAQCAKICASLPKNWKPRPDGLSFLLKCEAIADAPSLCNEVAAYFINDNNELSLRYEAFPKYLKDDLPESAYFKLLIGGDEIDLSPNNDSLNEFKILLCGQCKHPEFASLKRPLLVNGNRVKHKKRKYFILQCSNGFRVLSKKLFEELENDIGDHVDAGSVAYYENANEALDDVVWIRPKIKIGDNAGKYVEEKCCVCGLPSIVRGRLEKRPFLTCFDFYEYLNCNAPIALSGNWYGNIRGNCVTWDVFASGKILNKMHELKTSNLVKEKQMICGPDALEYLKNIEKRVEKIFADAGLLYSGRF